MYTTLTGTYGFYFHQHGGWFRYIHNFSCFLNHILFFFFTSQSAHFKRKIIKTTKTKIKMNITKIIPCMQRLCMRFFFFFWPCEQDDYYTRKCYANLHLLSTDTHSCKTTVMRVSLAVCRCYVALVNVSWTIERIFNDFFFRYIIYLV